MSTRLGGRLTLATEMRPQLYSWGARALFIGPSLDLAAHRNAVAVVAVGLDRQFLVANDPRRPERGGKLVRTALIPPDTLHKLISTQGRMAFLYVDASSRDLLMLNESVGLRTDRAGFHLAIERSLLKSLRALASGALGFAAAKRALERLLQPGLERPDHKLERAINYLHRHAAERPSLERLAKMVSLSPSRFRHAFKDLTGVSLRRYRVWIAMGHAMRGLSTGKRLTDAAHDAGFSSSAHFSFAFKEMFGLAPSLLVKQGLQRAGD